MSSTYLDDLNRVTRAFLRAQATDARTHKARQVQARLKALAYTPPTLTPLQRLAAQVLHGPAPYELPDTLPTPPTPPQDAPTMTPTTTPNKPRRRPTYSLEQKARALQLHSAGVEVLAIAAQLNIGKTTIYAWITEQRDPNAPKRTRTTTPRTSQPAPTAPTAPTATTTTTALERIDAIDAQIKALEAEREALRGALEAEREALTAQLNRLTQALSK